MIYAATFSFLPIPISIPTTLTDRRSASCLAPRGRVIESPLMLEILRIQPSPGSRIEKIANLHTLYEAALAERD